MKKSELNTHMQYYKIIPEHIVVEADKSAQEMGEANNSFGRESE